jgi:sterol desaturase/sphingolipid hydroxylase (fatty acid hydroxylase superfamily)
MTEVWDFVVRIVLSDNMLMTVLVLPFVLLFEFIRPLRKTPLSHYLFGVRYWLANLVLLTLISPALNTAVAFGIQLLGFGFIDLRAIGMPGLWGALFAVLVSTFIADFFYYWFHRTLHSNRYLWQTHLLHHSDEQMNALTAQRGHFTEGLLAPLFITIPTAILFKLPPLEIGVLSLIPYAYQFFAHANLNVGFGPFWWLLISPNYHRIHHSIEKRHYNKNFTNWFPIWDIIFGTVYVPARDEFPETGVAGFRVRTLREAFLHPFVNWYRLLTRRPRSRDDPDATADVPAREV